MTITVSAPPATSTTRATPPSPTTSSPALAVLATLPVKGRAPKTGYDRAMFGQAWSDDHAMSGGRNGCDTRNDVLRRDLTDVVLKPGTNGCVILTGALRDPFGGSVVGFERGPGTSSLVQVDHLVALSNAWQTGAQRLTVRQRQDLANDPLNLLAVQGRLNAQKGDGDAATWLPPRKTFRCTYAARQVAVKQRHHLWVTAPERDALRRVLTTCPGQRLPTAASTAVPPVDGAKGATSPSRQPSPVVPTPTSSPVPTGTVSYENCDAARAAGAAPLHRGDPGYASRMDGDDDGVACE
ncbi:DUF1524 domain-containing protein [Janibacter sp. UYMM211]|uniref:GmrSD restriction endonuclease domain-containing protein n=1 Tax=Janibacter sp. UYMM211 TaxID=3156342 RepID=UPI0033944879